MKKHLSTLAILVCVGLTTFAQQKGNVEVGINVGLNFAKLTTNNYYENQGTDFVTGLTTGISGEYYFSNSWGIKAKINYNQKGWGNGFYTDINGNTTTTDFKLNYVTIPLMANWHFGRTKNWYLNFGPYIGFLTSATATATGTDVKSYINSTDAGLAYGIGVKIPLSDNVKFFAEYQIESGLANISNNSTNDNNSTTLLNSSFGLNVGAIFNLNSSGGHGHRNY